MKQLLAISWEMPPLSGPRAVQVTRTLKALVPLGWRSRVVCFGPRSNRYNQDYRVSPETMTGGAVTRIAVPSPEEWIFFRALWRIWPAIKQLPDEKRVWVGRAVAAARRTLSDSPADLIISFAAPWSDHLVALRLHAENHVPWVAHFSDPWVDSAYAKGASWPRRRSVAMERDVIAHASRVVFVNQQTADRVMSKYPREWRLKARVVPQGYELDDIPAPVTLAGPLRMVYTGRFYDGVRTPDALLRAIAAIQQRSPLQAKLAVDIVGGAMEPYARRAAELGIDRIVRFVGRRSPADALAAASTADVLLSIDAPSDGPSMYLPSKLVDYLPLRKPILALTPDDGASADLVRRLGYPVVGPSDIAGIAAEIERLMTLKSRGALAPSPAHDEVSRDYDIRATTRALHDVMEEALRAT